MGLLVSILFENDECCVYTNSLLLRNAEEIGPKPDTPATPAIREIKKRHAGGSQCCDAAYRVERHPEQKSKNNCEPQLVLKRLLQSKSLVSVRLPLLDNLVAEQHNLPGVFLFAAAGDPLVDRVSQQRYYKAGDS